MKKLLVLGVIMGLATTGLVLAQAPRAAFDPVDEMQTVSGTAVVDDWGRISIRSGATTYHIMPAFAIPQSAEIANGDRIEVLGYEMPGPRFGTGENDRFIRAEELSIGGRTYVLDSARHRGRSSGFGHRFDGRPDNRQLQDSRSRAPRSGESYGRGPRR